MPHETIIAIDSRSDLMPSVYAVRHEVFVVEQRVPAALERDALDDTATHLVALRGGTVVGTLRIVVGGDTARIGRMAVRAAARHGGIGARLMQSAAEVASQMGAHEIILHAQLRAREFYFRLGYREKGSVFDEAGIPHIAMRKAITQS